jgi:hypothetical protein
MAWSMPAWAGKPTKLELFLRERAREALLAEKEPQDNVFIVEGSKGKKYNVKHENEVWECTCVGFGYRRKCKHVEKAKEMQKSAKKVKKVLDR